MDGKKYKWSVFPLVEESLFKTELMIIILIVVFVAIQRAFDIYHAIVALILLMFSLVKYFTKTTYELGPDGVRINLLFFSTFRKWNYYVRYSINNNGVFLSPFIESSRFDNFKGSYLSFGKKSDREMIEKLVAENIKRHLDS